MGTISVNDIVVTPLKRITVAGGDVCHAMKRADAGYVGFGEAYFSFIKYKEIKAWKRHLQMTLNLVMPIGNAHFVFVDDNGNVREELIGDNTYVRLTVPPSIWYGFQGLSQPYSLLLNIADIPHEPDEIERKMITEICFCWGSE